MRIKLIPLIILTTIFGYAYSQELKIADSSENDLSRLEVKIDSIFKQVMEERFVPGAIFSMVRGDSIVMLKGYGVANLDKNVSVDPQKTIFRVASISKTVSATAVMQMVERGVINLSDPVNKHLKNFKLPDNFGIPTTIAHLLTHTSGYDQSGGARRTLDPVKMEPMVTYFPKAMPRQVFPPGKIISYSTWMGSMAGYLTEEISGIPFNDYMIKNIFEPLEMSRSGYIRKELPVDDMAQGYFHRNGNYSLAPFEYTKTVPGTMLMTTAEDMSHLLIMHLNQGRFNGKQILNEKSIEDMHSIQFTADPRMLGATYGLYEMWVNGRRILTHSGGFDGFMAQLYIIPEKQLAFFTAFNQRNGGAVVNREVRNTIFDHFIPAENEEPSLPEPIYKIPLERFMGSYQSTSISISSLGKLDGFDGRGQWEISHGNGDTLLAFDQSYVAIEPLLFRRADRENSYLKFYDDSRGNITHATFGGLLSTHRKLKWYENVVLNQVWLSISMLTFAAVLIISLIRSIRKRLSKEKYKITMFERNPWRWLTFTSTVYAIAFLGIMIGPSPNRYEIPVTFMVMLALLLLAAFLSLLLLYFLYKVWKDEQAPLGYKWLYSIISIITLMFIVFQQNWNILGLQY